MDPALLGQIAQQGLLGAVCVVLLWVCKTLWDRNNELQQARLDDKDKRLDDTKQMMTTVTAALKTVDTMIGAATNGNRNA